MLCAIGPWRGAEMMRRAAAFARAGDELVLLHVIDAGPRHDLDRLRGPLHAHHERHAELDRAEEEAGRAGLAEAAAEAARVGLAATERLERGRPEEIIVAVAAEAKVDLVVLFARESPQAHPRQGPPSVGRTARFVLDHAPAAALLLREQGGLDENRPRHAPPPP